MGERLVGVENGSGINQIDDKLANGGGVAVCRVAGMCHGLWPWTLYNVVDVKVWIHQSFLAGITRTEAGQVYYYNNS